MLKLGLRDLPGILRRHPKKSLATFCGLMGLSIAALLLLPRAYESESLLFVRVGRNIALDPTDTIAQTIALNESRESELNSILEVFKSRATMERVVERLGPDAILLAPADDGIASSGDRLERGLSYGVNALAQFLEPTGPVSDREKAVQALSKNATISIRDKSNVISVAYKARSPRQAQAIVAALVDEYGSKHQQIHATPGLRDFLVEQEAAYRDKLDAAQFRLTNAKNAMGLASLEGKRQLIEDRIRNITTEQLTLQTSVSASSARIASLDKLIQELSSALSSQELDAVPNGVGDRRRQQLYALEVQARELRSKYTEDHPLVIAAQHKIDDATRILDEQGVSSEYATAAVNPSVQTLQNEVLTEKSANEALHARLLKLDSAYAVAQEDLKSLNFNELRLNKLMRELSLAEANYRGCATKLDEVRLQHSLDKEQISNLIISQPASLVEKPVGPKMANVLIPGFVVACIGAFCVAVFTEMNNRVLRSPADIEDQLGIPVVATIPAQKRNVALMT